MYEFKKYHVVKTKSEYVHLHVFLQTMGQGACAGFQKHNQTKKECGESFEGDDISYQSERHNINSNNNNYLSKVYFA